MALARGWLSDEVEVDYALKPDDAPEDAPAQPAQTTLRCLAHLEWPEAYDQRHASTRVSLVEALPKTGRRHQIRRHLKHESHPIIGDATHGKGPLNRWWAERIGLHRLWLHAHALEIPHPRTGEVMRFCADWRQLAHVPEVQQWQQLLAIAGRPRLASHSARFTGKLRHHTAHNTALKRELLALRNKGLQTAIYLKSFFHQRKPLSFLFFIW